MSGDNRIIAPTKIVGIDPGQSGAIAIMDMDGVIDQLHDMPTIKVGKKTIINGNAIVDIFLSSDIKHVFIEKAGVMPKQGVVSSATFVGGYNFILGICVGMGIPYTTITPQRWKKEMLDGMPKEKGSSIVRVNQLYTSAQLTRKKDHGIADSILICEYGRRQGVKDK